jgi:hypothetical protein
VTVDHVALEDAVRRLLEIDERRVSIVRFTGLDIADGVRLTQPIMEDYTAVIAELRELVG